MSNYIMKESNTQESDLIVDKIVKYNLSKVPLKQEIDFLWINRVIEDLKGEIIAGILSKMYCWNCLYIDTFDFQAKDFYIKHGFEVFGTLDECPQGHKRYYMKKNI